MSDLIKTTKKIVLHEAPAKSLYLRQSIADGEWNGVKFDVGSNLSNGDIIVTFYGKESVTYVLQMKDVVDQAIENEKDKLSKNNGKA